jgi:Zn-dependent protease
MLRSWRIGQAFGIGLYVHWSFLLTPGMVLFSNLTQGTGVAAFAVVLTLAVFGCVLLHELGHALMARTYGIATRDITLYPIGGVARLERMPEQPRAEVAIALAGPAVNVAIAAGLALGMYLSGRPMDGPMVAGLSGHEFVHVLLSANILLVLFNLIPAFPMDGGRVLRAALAMVTGRLKATEIAATLGVVLAIGFMIFGIFRGQPMLALVGLFVLFAGQQELAMVRMQEMQRQAGPGPPAGAMPQSFAGANFNGYVWDPAQRVWVVWQNGRPVGACSVDDSVKW